VTAPKPLVHLGALLMRTDRALEFTYLKFDAAVQDLLVKAG
jgi:hypothetical protein